MDQGVRQALRETRAGKDGFADQLIARVGFANGVSEIITFDEQFAKTTKVKRLK